MTALSQNRMTISVLLLAGTFIAILNQTLMITAIPPIMQEMNVSANSAQWLTTVFMLVNGVMIPISAFFIERFTTRQLFLTAMGIFAAGTCVAAIAPSFSVLLLGRVIQSAGAGVLLPLMQTVFLYIFPVNRRGYVMGWIGFVISFAPAIGPALSGWVLAHFSWRMLFFFILPLALIDWLIAYFLLKNVTKQTQPKIDIRSIVYSSIGFGSLLYGFTSAGNRGWTDALTWVTLTTGACVVAVFILRQLRLNEPMLEFRVFRSFTFTITTIIGMIGFMGLIGVETLIPLYMQNMRDFTAMEAGLAILPGALVMGVMSPVTGKLFDRYGAKGLVVTGMVITSISTLAFTRLSPDTSFMYMMILYSIRMFGLSMVLMPATTAGLNALPRRLLSHGAAMSNTMRQVAASVGTALIVTVMTNVAETAAQSNATAHPLIYGTNVAFFVLTVLSVFGLALAVLLRNTSSGKSKRQSKKKHSLSLNRQTARSQREV